MELNAEINRIVGEETAKLLVARMSDEEISNLAKDSLKFITSRKNDWGKTQASMLDDRIKEQLEEKVIERVNELLKEEITVDFIEKEARAIVDEAKKAYKEVMVQLIAERMASASTSIDPGYYDVHNAFAKIRDRLRNLENFNHLESPDDRYELY